MAAVVAAVVALVLVGGAVLPRSLHADRGHPRYDQRLASVGVANSVVEVAVRDGDGHQLPGGERKRADVGRQGRPPQ